MMVKHFLLSEHVQSSIIQSVTPAKVRWINTVEERNDRRSSIENQHKFFQTPHWFCISGRENNYVHKGHSNNAFDLIWEALLKLFNVQKCPKTVFAKVIVEISGKGFRGIMTAMINKNIIHIVFFVFIRGGCRGGWGCRTITYWNYKMVWLFSGQLQNDYEKVTQDSTLTHMSSSIFLFSCKTMSQSV